MFQSNAILFVTCSLMMIPCGSKHVEILVAIQYEHPRKNVVHFIG